MPIDVMLEAILRPVMPTLLCAIVGTIAVTESAAQISVLTHPNQFTPDATVVLFNGVPGPITTQYSSLGLSFQLTNGQGVPTLNDDSPRPYGPSAGLVLTTLGQGNVGIQIDFATPQNRVAFEMRTAADEDLVVDLSCLCSSGEMEITNFVTDLNYSFVALESASGFDQLTLTTTGGSQSGLMLLDNLRFEAFQDCVGAEFSDGFEDGDLDDWSTVGSSAAISSSFGTAPASGQFGAFLTTAGLPVPTSEIESLLELPAGLLDSFIVTTPLEGVAMARTFQVQPGDTLSFSWNFMTNELTPANFSNDFAVVTLSPGTAQLLASTATGGFRTSVTPFLEETGIRAFEHTFTAAETVQLGFAVLNATDGNRDSALMLDCVLTDAKSGLNKVPVCSADLTDAMNNFLEVAPGAFVVTEGQTFNVAFSAQDDDADPLTMTASGVPPTGSLTPESGSTAASAQLTWTPTSADKAITPLTVELTFTDPSFEGCMSEVTIADINLNPVCDAGGDANGDIKVECAGPDGTQVTLNGTATDADDPVLQFQWEASDQDVVLDDPTSQSPTGLFPIGITMVTLTVNDGRGGFDTSDINVIIEDTTPPEVMTTTSLAYLFPANHRMIPVEIVLQADDACLDPQTIMPVLVTVSSSEPDDSLGLGDGSTTGDVNGFDGFITPVDVTSSMVPDPLVPGRFTGTILLRSELVIRGSGRTYTIDALATDSSGNSATTSCVVIVPDRRR